jgi:hypothetical protein
MPMDNPTRIGLGGTALFTVAGSVQPLFGWWVSGPIMAVCAAIAGWGLWPLVLDVPRIRTSRLTSRQRWTIGFTLLAAIALTDYLAISTFAARKFATASVPTPPTITSTAWITEQDIGLAARKKWVLINMSPRDLSYVVLNRGPDATEIYVGRWIKVSGQLEFVRIRKGFKGKENDYDVVNLNGLLFFMYFERSTWENRISQLQVGQFITAFCQIEGFEAGWTYTNKCELAEASR